MKRAHRVEPRRVETRQIEVNSLTLIVVPKEWPTLYTLPMDHTTPHPGGGVEYLKMAKRYS